MVATKLPSCRTPLHIIARVLSQHSLAAIPSDGMLDASRLDVDIGLDCRCPGCSLSCVGCFELHFAEGLPLPLTPHRFACQQLWVWGESLASGLNHEAN